RLRRVFVERLPDHVVEPAFDLCGVALLFPRNGTPYQGAGTWVARVDHQRAFRIGDSHNPCTPTSPTRPIDLPFHSPVRAEFVANMEIGRAGSHECEPFRLH